jgi:hypothetical protein
MVALVGLIAVRSLWNRRRTRRLDNEEQTDASLPIEATPGVRVVRALSLSG